MIKDELQQSGEYYRVWNISALVWSAMVEPLALGDALAPADGVALGSGLVTIGHITRKC
jgi:hypothetical protein